MAERAISKCCDLVLLGSVFTSGTHPGVVVQKGLASHHTHGKPCITTGTSGGPGGRQTAFGVKFLNNLPMNVLPWLHATLLLFG